MPKNGALPADFPEGTKYVIESHGAQVRRHVEYPDGRRIELPPRKALTCSCAELGKAKATGKRATEPVGRLARKAA